MDGFHAILYYYDPFPVSLEMNMIMTMIENEIDDGDVGSEDVEQLLRDLLPPLAMVVVNQPSANKIPGKCSIMLDPNLINFTLPVILYVLHKFLELACLKALVQVNILAV